MIAREHLLGELFLAIRRLRCKEAQQAVQIGDRPVCPEGQGGEKGRTWEKRCWWIGANWWNTNNWERQRFIVVLLSFHVWRSTCLFWLLFSGRVFYCGAIQGFYLLLVQTYIHVKTTILDQYRSIPSKS